MKNLIKIIILLLIFNNLQTQKTLTDNSELIIKLKDLYFSHEINRGIDEQKELLMLGFMHNEDADEDEIKQSFQSYTDYCQSIKTEVIKDDSLRYYLQNYINLLIELNISIVDKSKDSNHVNKATQNFYKKRDQYHSFVSREYATQKFIKISEDYYWERIDKNNYTSAKEYLIYDSLKTTNVKNAVKFLDSISLITSDFQEYSIYQIEIADQQIINGDEFSVDEDGLLIGEKVALEKYLELLEKKEYSLYLFEAWRKWRSVYQYQNGSSKFSFINNDLYNNKRKEISFFILDFIKNNPQDDLAINQFLLFATQENILRFGPYDYGNQNALEMYNLFPEKYNF
ncbi:MAG: hypothetical protein CMD02_03630 [Flavobacteriales bacterium]|nr:hypothetical protein [Flavobacteriales bacterium]